MESSVIITFFGRNKCVRRSIYPVFYYYLLLLYYYYFLFARGAVTLNRNKSLYCYAVNAFLMKKRHLH